jgi:hypothetical protein
LSEKILNYLIVAAMDEHRHPLRAERGLIKIGLLTLSLVGVIVAVSRIDFSPLSTPSQAPTEETQIAPTPPKLPAIDLLQINGKPIGAKYLVPLTQQRSLQPLTLTWMIQGDQDLQVELLPAPGKVKAQGSITYKIAPRAATETLTLRATNRAGQVVTRSIAIEVFDPGTNLSLPPKQVTQLPNRSLAKAAAPKQVSKLPASAATQPLPLLSPMVAALPTGTVAPQGVASTAIIRPVAPSVQPLATADPSRPTPIAPNTLSPVELSPRFDQ